MGLLVSQLPFSDPELAGSNYNTRQAICKILVIKREGVNLWHKLVDAGMHSKPFPKRSLIGSTNSLMKRGCGSWVSSRVWHGQFGELVVKSLTLNPKQSLRKMIHSIIRLTKVFPGEVIPTKLTAPQFSMDPTLNLTTRP